MRLLLRVGQASKNEHRTLNIECRMGKEKETKKLIKIFVTSIKTVEKKQN